MHHIAVSQQGSAPSANATDSSMLTQMRALSQNFFGRAILGVVLVLIIGSFAIWGIGDRFTGYDAGQIAQVGPGKITIDQYRNAFRNELQRLQQQQKRPVNGEEAKRLGVDRQVLSRLLTDTLLEQQATKLGLAVGNDEIVRLIERDPSFFDPATTRFDRNRFNAVLSENGYTEISYATAERRLVLRQEVSEAVVGGLQLPAIVSDAVHRFQAEVRDADFFILPPAAAGSVAAPSEADLKSYYDAHTFTYTAPEFRKLDVLAILPVDLVKPDAVTPDEVKKRYDEQKAARFEHEQRIVEQLVFPDAAAAQAAEAKIKAGASFDTAVTDDKKTPADVSLGTVGKADIVDPAVAAAAFALPEGGTSSPVKGQFGTVLVHVSKIIAGTTQSLMEVTAQLKDEIAIIKARQQAKDEADKVEDARAAGKSLPEVAASVGMKTRTIEAVDAQGRNRDGRPVEGLVAGPQLLKAAFSAEPNSDPDVIHTDQGGSVWFAVTKVDAAHQLPFADVKPKVAAAWRAEETTRKLASEGDEIVKAIDGGKTLATAAAEAKQPVMQARNVGRGGAPELPSTEASALFEHPVGKAGSVSAQGRGRLVFKVEAARVPPIDSNESTFKKLIDQVKSGYEDDVIEQYLARVQTEVGVTINKKALATALGDEPGS